MHLGAYSTTFAKSCVPTVHEFVEKNKNEKPDAFAPKNNLQLMASGFFTKLGTTIC